MDIPNAGFDITKAILNNILDGKTIATVDQQPYYQGSFSILQLYLNNKYGLLPCDINTGGAIIDKTNAAIVLDLADTHRLVVVGFDMFASRWPLRVGFPIFLANVVRHLGGVEMTEGAVRARPGSTITLEPPPETTETVEVAAGAAEGGPVTESDAAGDVVEHMVRNYKGVGRKTAETLAAELGTDVFDVIDANPDRIRSILPGRRADAVIAGRAAEGA